MEFNYWKCRVLSSGAGGSRKGASKGDDSDVQFEASASGSESESESDSDDDGKKKVIRYDVQNLQSWHLAVDFGVSLLVIFSYPQMF